MSRRRFVMSLLGIALCGASIYGQQFGTEPVRLELVKLADDLYVIYNEFVPGNITALITDAGVVLVDVKYAVDHANVMEQLSKVTRQPVRYVINTHYHADHSGGLAVRESICFMSVAPTPTATSSRSSHNIASSRRATSSPTGARSCRRS